MNTTLLLSPALWILSSTLSLAALTVTITNPTPADYENFGFAVAALGNDRVLIGAYRAGASVDATGAAYLFNTNGTLLTTFINPIQVTADFFGCAVAAVGVDKVLVGAYGKDMGVVDAGAAFLFHTNGTLLTTFTNPTPAGADKFGASVAALGSDRVLISAYADDAGATDAGVVHVFRTNGTLLTTITDPTPSFQGYFGYAVAALGSDKVLVGATSSEGTYLVTTNGTHLLTFTNPSPASSDFFGCAMAVIGVDRVLIGAYGKDIGSPDAGAAFLFATNGTLLTSFTNPTPTASDWFGRAVAAVNPGKVLIGSPGNNTGGADAGAAHLFSTEGMLLTTFTNPTPASSDYFGWAVAAAGGSMPLIGAQGDNTGATDAGAVYLFGAYLEPPLVTVLPASPGTDVSVALSGTVNPNGSSTLVWFEWGVTTNYSNTTAVTNVGGGLSSVPVIMAASNLTAGTVYQYRIVASNTLGVVAGSNQTFAFPIPMVLAETPTDVTATSATLHGTVYPEGWPVTAWFRWREANGNGADETNGAVLRISQRTNGVPLSQPITGLVPGRTYTFDLWVSQGSFTAYQTGAFTTPLPAIPITFSGSSITPSNATLAGSVNPRSLPSRTWFEWGTTINYGNTTASLDVGAGNSSVPVNMDISQLSGLSDYHFRLVVSNAAGVFYGEDNELSTPPGRQVADGFYVTPTLIPANTATRVTATACGDRRFPTSGDWRISLTLGGQPVATKIAIVSATATKAVFNFPSRATDFYGFLVQYSNRVTHAWEDIYESGPRFFQVGEDAVAHTYNPFPRGNWTVPTQPKNFIGTESRIVTGVIRGWLWVPQRLQPHAPSGPPWDSSEFENSGSLHLGWTKDFRFDGESQTGLSVDFSFPMEGHVTFNYDIPFQFILDFPTNVYAGQQVQLKARDFRFHGGTFTVQHNLAFSTYHKLWLNAPYDLGFPPLVNEHSFEPDRLVVWGRLPVAPFKDYHYGPLDSREFPWNQVPYADLFDDGKVTIAEIADLPDFTGLPDYLQSRVSYANITLGGQMSYTTSGNTNRFWYGPHEVWTTGPHEGWQDTPQLWYANADMIGLTYVSGIPYYSQAAAPLFFAGVELGLNCGVNVRSRDVISLKPPYSHDLTVRIPASAAGSYTVATNLSLPIDATFVSYYLYKLWGGLYFDMPFIDRKDLAWANDDFWRPEVSANISVTATFAVNQNVWVTNKPKWIAEFLGPLPLAPEANSPEPEYDLISYPPAEADEERRWIADLTFKGPPPPPMVPSIILDTFPTKAESEFALVLSSGSSVGGTVVADPPPVDGGYAAGTLVTLSAIAGPGYKFTGWSGEVTGTDNSTTVTMNDDRTNVTANFETVLPPVVLVNPSFEADTFTVWPGYRHNNGPITGWTAEASMGINPVSPFGANDSPFADNGAIPDGRQVAFLQQDGALRQVVSGLAPGAHYRIEYWENAREAAYGGTSDGPILEVRIGTTVILPAHEVRPLHYYRQRQSQSFTATSEQMELAFEKAGPLGLDRTVLIDNVRVIVCAMATRLLPSLANGSVTLSWDPATTGATLESAESLDPTAQWTPVPGVVNNKVTLPAQGSNRFYRLRW